MSINQMFSEMARPSLLTKGRPVDPFANSSISDTVKKVEELGTEQSGALEKTRALEDQKVKEKAAKAAKPQP
jgi:hypothetical protein